MDKQLYILVGDSHLLDETRESFMEIEGETFNLNHTTQFMSGKLHYHLCKYIWDIPEDLEECLRVYPIADFNEAVNNGDETFEDAFISHVFVNNK